MGNSITNVGDTISTLKVVSSVDDITSFLEDIQYYGGAAINTEGGYHQ